MRRLATISKRAARPVPGILLLLSVALLTQACSDDAETPAQEIRRFIDSAVAAGEQRSVDALNELVHASFVDQQGRNRGELALLLRGYFFRNKNIHLFTRIDSIDILDDRQANVILHVAMAGSTIADVDAIASLRARIYRFELQLVKQQEWRLRHANWAPASIGGFD